MKLNRSFYQRGNVNEIAKDLVGKVLYTYKEGNVTGGIIVETEAYNGREDKASHAFNKRTKRNEIMYGDAGFAYVYLCYGIHRLFNIVTNREGLADAVLIRAIEPLEGIEIMEKRRKMKLSPKLTSGPGKLSEALSIQMNDYGVDLTGNDIWIEERDRSVEIIETTRIGIDYAEEDALLPWRYYLKDNKYVSKF